MNVNTVIRATVGTAAAALCGLAGLVAAMAVGHGELVVAGLAAGVAAGGACVVLKMLERSGFTLADAMNREGHSGYDPMDDEFITLVNPATGLVMVGGMGGVDAMGNPYGYRPIDTRPPAA